MSDFETFPVGTGEYIKELEANVARLNEACFDVIRIIENSPPDSKEQLCCEILGNMLNETPKESLNEIRYHLTNEEREKAFELVEDDIHYLQKENFPKK